MEGFPLPFRRVLVTGGAGFIGAHLCRALLRQGVAVTVLDDLSRGLRQNVPEEARFILASVLDPEAVVLALEGAEAVVHLAARVTIRGSVGAELEDSRVNLLGSVNLWQALPRSDVRHVVLASSMAVYGPPLGPRLLCEEDPCRPLSAYGVNKLAAERHGALVAQRLGLTFQALRLFNTYGPGMRHSPYVGVLQIFARAIREHQEVVLYDAGRPQRDFIHVEDVVAGFMAALARPGVQGAVNIGTGCGTQVAEALDLLESILGWSPPRKLLPARPEELPRAVADITRARRELAFVPRFSLANGLASCINDL